MTAGVDWPEYRRRLAIRQARRAHVETLAGYTAAPIRLWATDLAGDSDGAAQTIATNKRSITIRQRGRR